MVLDPGPGGHIYRTNQSDRSLSCNDSQLNTIEATCICTKKVAEYFLTSYCKCMNFFAILGIPEGHLNYSATSLYVS